MKQKTKQAARKRFSVTAGGKVRRRRPRQAHFNARATGNATRHKHGSAGVDATDLSRVARLLPYETYA